MTLKNCIVFYPYFLSFSNIKGTHPICGNVGPESPWPQSVQTLSIRPRLCLPICFFSLGLSLRLSNLFNSLSSQPRPSLTSIITTTRFHGFDCVWSVVKAIIILTLYRIRLFLLLLHRSSQYIFLWIS